LTALHPLSCPLANTTGQERIESADRMLPGAMYRDPGA